MNNIITMIQAALIFIHKYIIDFYKFSKFTSLPPGKACAKGVLADAVWDIKVFTSFNVLYPQYFCIANRIPANKSPAKIAMA